MSETITWASVYLQRICGSSYRWEEERETIEKVIKFAKIVEKKNINVGLFKGCCNSSYEEYKESWSYFHKGQFKSLNDELLTEEEYNLLKEVLA